MRFQYEKPNKHRLIPITEVHRHEDYPSSIGIIYHGINNNEFMSSSGIILLGDEMIQIGQYMNDNCLKRFFIKGGK